MLHCLFSPPPTPYAPSFPTRRSSDLRRAGALPGVPSGTPLRGLRAARRLASGRFVPRRGSQPVPARSEEHTSELQSPCNLVCRLLLEKKNLYLLLAYSSSLNIL